MPDIAQALRDEADYLRQDGTDLDLNLAEVLDRLADRFEVHCPSCKAIVPVDSAHFNGIDYACSTGVAGDG